MVRYMRTNVPNRRPSPYTVPGPLLPRHFRFRTAFSYELAEGTFGSEREFWFKTAFWYKATPALFFRSVRYPYRPRRRCTKRLTPFLAVRCARGSRASFWAPRRTISPRPPLPLSFFLLLATRHSPLLILYVGSISASPRSCNQYTKPLVTLYSLGCREGVFPETQRAEGIEEGQGLLRGRGPLGLFI